MRYIEYKSDKNVILVTVLEGMIGIVPLLFLTGVSCFLWAIFVLEVILATLLWKYAAMCSRVVK